MLRNLRATIATVMAGAFAGGLFMPNFRNSSRNISYYRGHYRKKGPGREGSVSFRESSAGTKLARKATEKRLGVKHGKGL